MIVLDIETSGLDPEKCGIWQIGAIEFGNQKNYFFEEARIDDEDEILNEEGIKPVLEVIGKTEAELRDAKKQNQKQLISNFIEWLSRREVKILAGENIGEFDNNFLMKKAKKYRLKMPSGHRTYDLHTVAQTAYYKIHGKYLTDENGKSNMGLTNCLEFCGMRDERKAHNALEDAKLEAECFSRLLNSKILFQEYEKYPLPEYLIKSKMENAK